MTAFTMFVKDTTLPQHFLYFSSLLQHFSKEKFDEDLL